MTPHYNDAGEPIAAVGFEYPDDEPQVNDQWQADRELVVALIGWLVEKGSLVEAGRRAMALGYYLRAEGAPSTVRELAELIGRSKSTAHRLAGTRSSEGAADSKGFWRLLAEVRDKEP